MWWLIAGGVICLNFSLIIGSTSPSVEYTELDYSYPDYMLQGFPFSVPGLAVADLHATQFLEALGRAWNEDRLIDGMVLMCEDLSPNLDRPGLRGIVQAICDPLRNSEVEKSCRFVWDLGIEPVGRYGHSFEFFFHDCRRKYGDYGKLELSFGFENFEAYETYPLIKEVKHLVDTVFNFTLYDFCSESGRGVEKINNIVFALFDWLGPLALFPLRDGIYEPIAMCSIGRYLLSMETTDIIVHSIGIWKYPLADVLEYLRTGDICHRKSDNVGIELLKDLLVEFSDMVEKEFCEDVSEEHTREEYLEKAVTILENMSLLFHEDETCRNIMSILAPLDEDHIHVKYVGFNLSVPSQRRDFCQQTISAFSPTSSFVPSPYRFPSDSDINEWQPFSIPGEFLPGLSFIDLIIMEGAAYRAGTIIEGWGVYCTVFEEFLVQIIDEETFDAPSICEFIKSGNTEGLEDVCVTLLNNGRKDESYRYGGLPYDPFAYMAYTIGDLTGVKDINKDDICRAADNLFHSDISFQNVIEFSVDVYMRELIPIANRYCKHWEEAICYWKPYCYLSDPPHRDYPPYYSPPSRETIAAKQASFDDKVSSVVSLILTMLGFDEIDAFCSAALEDIDPTSGRAAGGLTERLRSELIRSFTIVSRCSQFLDTVFGLVEGENVNRNDGGILHQLSGFRSSSAFCKFFSDSVLQSGRTTSQPDTTESKDALVASYDIFMKIAVYLQGKTP